jgi:hypothetical protein
MSEPKQIRISIEVRQGHRMKNVHGRDFIEVKTVGEFFNAVETSKREALIEFARWHPEHDITFAENAS